MKKSLAAALSLCSLSATLFADQDDWSLNNHFSLTGEFVYMRRQVTHDHEIVRDSNKTICMCPNFRVLGTEKLVQKFGFEPGYRVGAAFMKDQNSTLEATYLFISEWHADKDIHGSNSLNFPFDNSNYTHDFKNASTAVGKYDSRFYNVEINYWRHVTPRRANYFSISWILGARYINLRERFGLAYTRGTNTSDYDINTKNQLWGGQAGGNVQINPIRKLSWDITMKIAGFYNFMTESTFLGDLNNTVVLRNFKAHKGSGTFLSDIAASLTYQCFKHLNVHIGYQFMYLSGLALAPEQMQKRTVEEHHHDDGDNDRDDRKRMEQHLYDDGDIIIQGVFVGLTLSF